MIFKRNGEVTVWEIFLKNLFISLFYFLINRFFNLMVEYLLKQLYIKMNKK
jgi:hypothetical protein